LQRWKVRHKDFTSARELCDEVGESIGSRHVVVWVDASGVDHLQVVTDAKETLMDRRLAAEVLAYAGNVLLGSGTGDPGPLEIEVDQNRVATA
jgi:hypothetical protein